jgi:hypothetical protein
MQGVQSLEHQLHAPRNQIVDGGRSAFVWYMHDLSVVRYLNNPPPKCPGEPLLEDSIINNDLLPEVLGELGHESRGDRCLRNDQPDRAIRIFCARRNRSGTSGQ